MQDRATTLAPAVPPESSEQWQDESTTGLGGTISRIRFTAFKLLITNTCQIFNTGVSFKCICRYPFILCLLTLSLTFSRLKNGSG